MTPLFHSETRVDRFSSDIPPVRRSKPGPTRMGTAMKAEQYTAVVTYHGEGPIWDSVAGVLRWVDMLNGDILTMAPDGSIGRQHVGTIAAAMRPRAGGGLVVAVEDGFVLIDGDGQAGPAQTAFADHTIRVD